MSNEISNIAEKNWARSVQYINKVGYMDGAYSGQTTSFQCSFNVGYEQGLRFGLKTGFQDALQSNHERLQDLDNEFLDPRRINCQLCINRSEEEKMDNLFNTQEEKNNEYLRQSSKFKQASFNNQ